MSWMETVTERGPLAHVCKDNVLHVLRFVKLWRLVWAAMQAGDWGQSWPDLLGLDMLNDKNVAQAPGDLSHCRGRLAPADSGFKLNARSLLFAATAPQL